MGNMALGIYYELHIYFSLYPHLDRYRWVLEVLLYMFLYFLLKTGPFFVFRTLLTARKNRHIFNYCKGYRYLLLFFLYHNLVHSDNRSIDCCFLIGFGTLNDRFLDFFRILYDFDYCGGNRRRNCWRQLYILRYGNFFL